MSYTINYSGIKDLEEKENRAIEDCKAYLGQELFDDMVEKLKGGSPVIINEAQVILGFVGIQGYPAEVFAKRYFNLKEE